MLHAANEHRGGCCATLQKADINHHDCLDFSEFLCFAVQFGVAGIDTSLLSLGLSPVDGESCPRSGWGGWCWIGWDI